MSTLSIYTITRSHGGYYGLCSKVVTKESLRLVHCEHGAILILNHRAVLVGDDYVGRIGKGIIKHEIDIKITDLVMSRLLKI